MLRLETKSRARALQLLYAWELRGRAPVAQLATGLSRLTGPEPRVLDRAESLASGGVESVESLAAAGSALPTAAIRENESARRSESNLSSQEKAERPKEKSFPMALSAHGDGPHSSPQERADTP